MEQFRAMRRLRQQLSEEESISILQKSTAGTLALLGDNDYPYAVPISYVYADAFCRELRENGAHIVGDCLYADAPTCNLSRSISGRSDTLENWICAISPNL